MLKLLEKDISVCPNGVCFVKEHVKKGILPRMVHDILKTRLMVKKSMKVREPKLFAVLVVGYFIVFVGNVSCTRDNSASS